MWIAAKENRLADDVWIAAKAPHPQPVAEHRDFRSIREVLFVGERSTAKDLGAKQLEVVGTDLPGAELLRGRTAGVVHNVGAKGGRILDDRGLLAPMCELLVGSFVRIVRAFGSFVTNDRTNELVSAQCDHRVNPAGTSRGDIGGSGRDDDHGQTHEADRHDVVRCDIEEQYPQR